MCLEKEDWKKEGRKENREGWVGKRGRRVVVGKREMAGEVERWNRVGSRKGCGVDSGQGWRVLFSLPFFSPPSHTPFSLPL